MCLDKKKLLILDTDMATNPCMYSGTKKKQHKKSVFSRENEMEIREQTF